MAEAGAAAPVRRRSGRRLCVCCCDLRAFWSSAQLSIIWMANEPMRPPAVPSAIEIDLAFTPCLFQALFLAPASHLSSRPVI
jgi:hypothetical protein